jgi:Arc/MetJ-type ribon-helix-helix transcriptional regulator
MKQKISVTIDEKTVKLIEKTVKEGVFRNKSHIVEFSLNKILKERQNERSL